MQKGFLVEIVHYSVGVKNVSICAMFLFLLLVMVFYQWFIVGLADKIIRFVLGIQRILAITTTAIRYLDVESPGVNLMFTLDIRIRKDLLMTLVDIFVSYKIKGSFVYVAVGPKTLIFV